VEWAAEYLISEACPSNNGIFIQPGGLLKPNVIERFEQAAAWSLDGFGFHPVHGRFWK